MRRSSRLKVSEPVHNDAFEGDISSLSSSLGSEEAETELPLPDPRTVATSENDNPFNYEFDKKVTDEEDSPDSSSSMLEDNDSSFQEKDGKEKQVVKEKETKIGNKRKAVGRDPLLTINEHVDAQHQRRVQKKRNYRIVEKVKIREFTKEEERELQRIREAYAEIDKYELIVEKIEE